MEGGQARIRGRVTCEELAGGPLLVSAHAERHDAEAPAPAEDVAGVVAVESSGEGAAASIRAYHDAVAALAGPALAALDRWDPDRSAMVLGSQFLESARVAHRRVWAGRRPAWRALED